MMAKKKAEKASPFVPVEEQPYQVPENWCWLNLHSISEICTGKKDANYGTENGRYPFFTCAAHPIRCDGYSFDCHAILLAGNGDISNISLFDGKFEAYQRTYVVKILQPIITEYCYYYFKYRWVDYNKDKMYGTAIPYIRLGNLNEFSIPIAPLAEQQRIVDRIESLFAKLDEAKEKVQEALDSFEVRRSSILRNAFSGKLTESWRKEHGKVSRWKYVRFDEAAYIRSNLVEPAEYSKMPHIAPDNIEKKTGKLLEYHTIEEDGVTSGKHHFFPGQILYSKIRPYLSKVVLVGFEGLCSADMYPIEAVGNTKFLWYQMLSNEFLVQASSAGSRSVLPKINQKELSALKVSITSDKDEETEIVRILDDFFAKETEAKEKVEVALDAIEAMKKSILDKAFRGELGTNYPEDESAEKLLKRILV